MTITFKALGALLAYPTPELVQALPEIRAAIQAEKRLGVRERTALFLLLAELGHRDLLDSQEHYVGLFDRGRSTSLNLFEHVHGDSRDRGPAMLDLRGVYEAAGFAFTANELPDYLPALLEFLSTQPFARAEEMLGDCAHILRAIGETLARRESPHAAVFAALLAMVKAEGLAPVKRAAPVVEETPVDDEWVDAPVIFGPAGAPGGCGAPRPGPSVIQFVPPASSARPGSQP
ncbi:MAG: nitrate reductase molybdenum cofactor assembly chaperone [Betaproteobacteria bacterium]|nr:nitrate reductase molybdenum cofactor assembly chaperone [Betaproteobacteria bacterium]